MGRTIARFLIVFLLSSGVAHGQKAQDIEAGVYSIDAARSDIYFLIYKAGALSGFGHNHIVSVGRLKGTVSLHSTFDRSTFEMMIPVNGLIVDDAKLRRVEGKDFSSQPTQSDRDGTRGNMLGKKLLNAGRFPNVRVTGRLDGKAGSQKATLRLSVELLGRVKKLTVPVVLKLTGNRLEASGTRKISHRELGLKPFTALFGALAVAEGMELKYKIRAQRRGP